MSYSDVLSEEAGTSRRERRNRKRRKRRRFGSFLAVLVSLALVGGIGYGAWHYGRAWLDEMLAPPADYEGPGQGSVDVTIPPGATLAEIGSILADADVVASRDAFINAANEHPQGRSIQSGDYTLRLQMSAADAVETLVERAEAPVTRVTIPEGYRVEQIVARVDEETELTEGDLLAVLDSGSLELPGYAEGEAEGFLFPATYDVRSETTAESLLQAIADWFKAAEDELDQVDRAENLGFSRLEIVTMAIIVHRVVRHTEDMPNVAEVIHNRLSGACAEHGVPDSLLQMDSTVHYAIGEFGDVFTTREQRRTDSPYNTYRYAGLPPGPIAAPGETALRAAMNPSGAGYCYFVTVDLESGETKFATTEEEHLANVAESRS